MSFKHRILRASSTLAMNHTGKPGELVMDTDLNLVYVHDGFTKGGHLVGLTKDIVQGMVDAAGFSAADKAKIQAVQDKLDGLGSMAYGNFSQTPFNNLMPDSGRFAGRINPLQLGCGDFATNTFFTAYNGATLSDAGKFTFDNSTYGGSGAALPEPIISLLTAQQGGTVWRKRYGVEYRAMRVTTGNAPTDAASKVTVNGVDYYLNTTNGGKCMFGADAYCTFAAWIRVVSGAMFLRIPNSLDNGEFAAARLLPAGWHLVKMRAQSDLGYDTAFPYLSTTVGSVFEIALPVFYNGFTDPGKYFAPIAGVNELIA